MKEKYIYRIDYFFQSFFSLQIFPNYDNIKKRVYIKKYNIGDENEEN